jgi:hypothetical protein
MRSETEPLPKGQSYPLKPSFLAAALDSAGIGIDVHLVRVRRSTGLFNAHFWPPNPDVPHERLYIQLGSVPTATLADITGNAETVLVPRLVKWIGDILSADERSPVRREQQTLHLGPL